MIRPRLSTDMGQGWQCSAVSFHYKSFVFAQKYIQLKVIGSHGYFAFTIFTRNNLINFVLLYLFSQSDHECLKNEQKGTHLFGAMHDLSNNICLCCISGIFYSPATPNYSFNFCKLKFNFYKLEFNFYKLEFI